MTTKATPLRKSRPWIVYDMPGLSDFAVEIAASLEATGDLPEELADLASATRLEMPDGVRFILNAK